jgi:methyl-accepting chemotaxis protein
MRLKLSLKRMLQFGFGLVAIVILLNGLYGFKSASENLNKIKNVYENGIPRNQQISILLDGVTSYRMAIKTQVTTVAESIRINAISEETLAKKQIEAAFIELKEMNLSERAIKDIGEIEHNLLDWEPVISQLKNSENLDSLAQVDLAEYESNLFANLVNPINDFNNRMDELILFNTSQVYESMNTARAKRNISLLIPIFLALGIGFTIQFDINKKMKKALEELENGNNQNLSASTQISESSQSLAGSSSEQAASVEEASATLEEISSMALNAKDDADQAVTAIENKVNQLSSYPVIQ